MSQRISTHECTVSVLQENSVYTVFSSVETRLDTLPRKPLEIMIQPSVFSELVPIFSSILQNNTYHSDSEVLYHAKLFQHKA